MRYKGAATPMEPPHGRSADDDASKAVVQPSKSVSWHSWTFLRGQPAAPVQAEAEGLATRCQG